MPGSRNGNRTMLMMPRPTVNMLTTARTLSVRGWSVLEVSIPL